MTKMIDKDSKGAADRFMKELRGVKPLEDILEAVNGLYQKVDEIVFELESIAAKIRKQLDEVDAEALAEQAMADDTKTAEVPAKAEPELDIF